MSARYTWPAAALLAGSAALWQPTTAASHAFLTGSSPYITLDPGVPAGSSVLAIINSGESYHGFTFQGLPDGIGLAPGPRANTVDVLVAHEETTVPFFGEADFQAASVSKLTLDTTTGAIIRASVAVPASAGFLRFCSASMAGPAEGFRHYTFFTGEETNDVVNVVSGAPYGPDLSLSPQRQAGYAVVLDVGSGAFSQIASLGRLNHENTIAIPRDNEKSRKKKSKKSSKKKGKSQDLVLLTTDDTFTAPSAQLYMYIAKKERDLFEDKGTLYAFRVTEDGHGKVDKKDPFNDANDYLDIQPGDDWRGEFIKVPADVARGETTEPPQDALENWSNEHNVFQFIRLEDIAYDKNDPNVLYFADTGATRVVPDSSTGRMLRGPSGTVGMADNGRIFKLVLDENNPRKVRSFSVLADADAPGSPTYVPMTSPDNIETSANSLMVQEDTGSAKIWRYDFATGDWSVVAAVNDPSGESSGIVDASRWFGDGAWILDVQAHGTDLIRETQPDGTTLKLEDGQLMLMRIPGT